jgi:hypothetical protein
VPADEAGRRTKEANSGPVGAGAGHPTGGATARPVIGIETGLPS